MRCPASHAALSNAMDIPLLNYYDAIEDASANMLEAAQRGNWGEVARWEDACSTLIDQLQHVVHTTVLGAEHLEARNAVMRRILDNDAEIRRLAERWIDELDTPIGGHARVLH